MIDIVGLSDSYTLQKTPLIFSIKIHQFSFKKINLKFRLQNDSFSPASMCKYIG